MYYYGLAFTWGILLFLSFIGWGTLLQRLLLPRREVDVGQRAAWGVAFIICLGGLLSLFSAISKAMVILLVGLGMGVFCLHTLRFIKEVPRRIIQAYKQKPFLFLAVCFILLLVILRYAIWIASIPRYTFDDLQAYLVYPFKMLQAGSLGEDPFSERRMHSLGGHSFLHALVFAVLKIPSFTVIDPAVGFLIVFILLWGASREKSVYNSIALGILLIFLFVDTFPYTSHNSTSMMMGLALCLALFRIFDRTDGVPSPKTAWAYACIGGFLIAALCACRLSFVGFCVFFIIGIYLTRLLCYSYKKWIAFELILVFILAVIFLLPWMISFYESSGTFLYPFLGKGYHRTAYGIPDYSMPSFKNICMVVLKSTMRPSCLFMAVLCFLGRKNTPRRDFLFMVIICISAMITFSIINVACSNGFDFLYRYSFSFLFAVLFSMMLYSFSGSGLLAHQKRWKIQLIVIGLFIPLLYSDVTVKRFLVNKESLVKNARVMLRSRLNMSTWDRKMAFFERMRQSYSKAQGAVPAGEIILARVTYPLLLDFHRNEIFTVDWFIPGPPPGFRVFGGKDAAADYLISKGIRYCLYSYGDEAGLTKDCLVDYLARNDIWLKRQAFFTRAFQRVLEELGRARKRIYDDGNIFVLDLKTPN